MLNHIYEIKFKRKFKFCQSRCNYIISELAKTAHMPTIDILLINITDTICSITVKCDKITLEIYIDFIKLKLKNEVKIIEIVEK